MVNCLSMGEGKLKEMRVEHETEEILVNVLLFLILEYIKSISQRRLAYAVYISESRLNQCSFSYS
jgi:hypothetical protein